MGISVVNFVTRVDTEVRRQGSYGACPLRTAAAAPSTKLIPGESTEYTGATQTFYTRPGHRFRTDYETLRRRFQMAFLNKGLRITPTDERVGEFRNAGGDPPVTHPRRPW